MTLKTALSLTLIATLIILSAGCIDNTEPEVIYVYVTPTPESTPVSILIPTPEKIDISVLSIYDRDGNGILNKYEQQVAITDYHYKRLTDDQIICLINVLGYVPTINPIPIPKSTIIPTPKQSLPTFPIPDDYYSCSPEDIVEGNIYEYLKYWKWNTNNQYELDKFDCSQMAAYMEFMLENSGYNVVIAVRDETINSVGHSWILVEFSDGWLAYECTSCHWIYKSDDPSYYTPDYVFEDIYDALDFCDQYIDGEKFFIKEFGWWIE